MRDAEGRPASVPGWWTRILSGRSLRTAVLAGLAVMILLTGVGAAVIYRAIAVAGRISEQIVLTTKVRAAAESLVAAISDAQTAERAFLLTGNERFLGPYTNALSAVPRIVTQLYAVIDDGAQIDHVRVIDARFARWRDQVAQPQIAARRAAPAGLAASSRAAASDAARLHATLTAHAAAGAESALRSAREQATALHERLTGILHMTPATLVSPESSRALTLLDTIAGARADAPPGSLLAAAAAVEAIAVRQALAAEAAESNVLAFITQRAPGAAPDAIHVQYAEFTAAAEERLAGQLAAARGAIAVAESTALAIPLFMMLLLLFGFYHATGATGAIATMIDASRGVAGGDFTRRVAVHRGDEIGQLAAAFNDMTGQIAIRDRRAALLRQMGEMLEASASADEALGVVGRYAAEMFPDTFGAVYLIRASRDLAEMAASWGEPGPHSLAAAFGVDDCWALRRGQVHAAGGNHSSVMCRHMGTPPPCATLCLPLSAQGETIGAVVIAVPDGRDSAGAALVSDATASLARAAGDRAGLAIANLKLTATLRAQSVRDPLTGVYNRRYLEETLEREVRRAERTGHTVGLIMFDIDGFKRFNDAFGHEAGDAYLRSLGGLLQDIFRREDVVCRYGGDEFVVVLPEASLDATTQRARMLGEAVKTMDVPHRGRSLGATTLSLGIAAFPEHGASGEAMLRAADVALYRAKQHGRARAEVAVAHV